MDERPETADLSERVKKLEDQVAWLTAQVQAPAAATSMGVPPQPMQRPAPRGWRWLPPSRIACTFNFRKTQHSNL